MSITMIAAMDRNGAIGVDNGLPWKLPADMAYFVRMTTGKTVLMGRKTFESFGSRPLRNRRNIVLSRNGGFSGQAEGYETASSVEEALGLVDKSEELMVIGGAEIYRLLLPYADKLLLTEIDTEVRDADSYFPAFDKSVWKLTDSAEGVRDEKNPYAHRFQTYARK